MAVSPPPPMAPPPPPWRRWNESRGVYDDICYLRQAHLFKQFGLDGLNTDIKRDDDHYLVDKLKAIGFPEWNDPSEFPAIRGSRRPPNMSCNIRREPASCWRCFPRAFRSPALRARKCHDLRLCAARVVPGARTGLVDARGGVRLCGALSDDQSGQGELFGGADDDGLRAGGIPDRETLYRCAAADLF